MTVMRARVAHILLVAAGLLAGALPASAGEAVLVPNRVIYPGETVAAEALKEVILAEGRTAFDGLPFQTRPFYSGNPWFLAPSVLYYSWRDRLAR